jgi:hypothetical protein
MTALRVMRQGPNTLQKITPFTALWTTGPEWVSKGSAKGWEQAA